MKTASGQGRHRDAARKPSPTGNVVTAGGSAREVLIRRVYRTGVQTVERDGDRYFLTIRNRTYASDVEVPVETARRYYRWMRES